MGWHWNIQRARSNITLAQEFWELTWLHKLKPTSLSLSLSLLPYFFHNQFVSLQSATKQFFVFAARYWHGASSGKTSLLVSLKTWAAECVMRMDPERNEFILSSPLSLSPFKYKQQLPACHLSHLLLWFIWHLCKMWRILLLNMKHLSLSWREPSSCDGCGCERKRVVKHPWQSSPLVRPWLHLQILTGHGMAARSASVKLLPMFVSQRQPKRSWHTYAILL